SASHSNGLQLHGPGPEDHRRLATRRRHCRPRQELKGGGRTSPTHGGRSAGHALGEGGGTTRAARSAPGHLRPGSETASHRQDALTERTRGILASPGTMPATESAYSELSFRSATAAPVKADEPDAAASARQVGIWLASW